MTSWEQARARSISALYGNADLPTEPGFVLNCSVFDSICYDMALEGTDREPHLRQTSRRRTAQFVSDVSEVRARREN